MFPLPGITLLSNLKVFSRLLERRVWLLVEPWIQEEQCGFHPGCETLDQLYTVARILEWAWEFAVTVYMFFVDLEKAYDCASQNVLAPGVWGRRPFVRGHSISVLLEPELGSHCQQ